MKYHILSLLLLAAFLSDAQTRIGRDYAVFFTVSNYDNPDIWPNLPQIPGEITELERLLRNEYGFEVKVVSDATGENIRNTLESYSNTALYSSDSQLLLFFAMHGQRTVQGQGYLIPKEGKSSAGSWLAHTQLRDIIDEIPCPRILASIDACFSGTFGSGRGIPRAADWEIDNVDCSTKRKMAFENKMPARKYLTAGLAEQRVPGQSKFAKRWQNALASKGGEDGILSFAELWIYLNQLDNTGIVPTHGVFGRDKSGDFVFVCKSCCSTTPIPESISQPILRPISQPFNDDLIFVKGGTFLMGCTSEQQDCDEDETPAHRVAISDFYLGKYEVTQQYWREVMGSDPAELRFKGCNQCPVEKVSWYDVQEFLNKLNIKYPGRNYRLPTEAEWEYAAREGGKSVLFGNGKNILDPSAVNFDGDWTPSIYSVKGIDRQKVTPVGSFTPNALGLYDMAGNVYEWCSDWYIFNYYQNSVLRNPSEPEPVSDRVIRGGSWYNGPQGCRTANRGGAPPNNRNSYIGFRLARTP